MNRNDLSTGCIHPLFEAQAAAHPDRDAVRWRGESLSYAELDARANRLAHHLRALGAGPEVAVGVFLPRTPDLIVALLAALKAGAAYVPLDPVYPPERVEYMLADTRVPVLVTTAALAERVPHYAGAVVRVDADAASIESHPSTSPEAAVLPENLAYVIYTSGSTGRPKGVQIEHRNTVPVLRWLKETVSDDERVSVLASTSVCFDVSIAEIFGTLCWGGTLVLVENALSLASLSEPVGTVAMVPSAAAELLRMGAIPACARTLLLGGEPLRNELAQRLYALGHVDRVLNLYGPTEDTTYSTCKEVEKGREKAMTVGRPVRGTVARVLDEAMRPVWDGDTGEVWMTGAGVTRGYLGAPGMTAERYRPDPLGAPGARMYRTGDLGRVLPDGDLECLGRMDHQVKVRGFRVEPGEIETALAAHPAVREAVVTAWEDRGEKRLAAYVVPEGAAPGTAELREHLRGRVPEYMVPDAFTFLAALPHTPNGKVDRLALPAPRVDREGSGEYVAPRTPEEAALARIWSEVLGVERVGIRDDFFELGGHSLLATQIAARVRQQMNAELPLGILFAMPTIEELARRVADAAAPLPSSTVIPRVARDRPLPLSYPQETVWFFQHLKPDMRSYNFQATVRVRGALDVEALRGALEEIVRRHEIFRTTFPAIDGAPAQVVHEPWPVDLPVEDISHLEVDEQRGELERRMKEEMRRPFDIAALPLVRWNLFRLGDAEHVLLAIEQHLVHDGWSFGVFLRELTALYPALARGEAPDLPAPAVQFGDYAAWQRAWMRSDEAREHLEWWKHRLAGVAPVLELPADRPRPAEMSFRGSSHRVRLPPALYDAADAFSRRHGVTLFMTLFAAFEALMHRYTGETDFCVGSGVAGRRLRETEDLIGMMVNTIPIRADLGGDPAFAELVERVRTAAVETYQHQEVPFAEIVAAVHPERSRGHLPVFQVAFNFHHAPYPELRLGDAEIEIEEGLGNESAKFDLNIIVIPRAHQHAGSEVVMIWEFAEDLFDAPTVRRMIGHFEAVLASALADPSTRVSRLRMLPADEERGVLALAGRATPFPRDATLDALVAEQARLRSGAPAIDHGGRTVTYAELDAASARVAAALGGMGVRAGDRVAVAGERSAELVTAMLGALKAGAAYVPLDPAYPAERLAFMLADSGAKALVVRDRVPPSLAGWNGPVLSLAALGDGAEMPVEAPDLGGDAAAYVVYTSGSTGTPKGSVISHRAAVRLFRGADFLQPRPGDRLGHTAAPSFDAAAWEIWAALTSGGTLVVLDRDDLLSPQRLGAVIGERKVSALFLTTALFNQVAHEAPETFAPLRDLLTGGEAADPAAFRRVLEACRTTRLVHMYGPSENATYSSWHPVRSVAAGAAAVPIGGPVANTTLYVLDASLRPVPSGVPGELYVGGEGLSRGYLGRPGLTAPVFLPNPFAAAPGARMYRTGDRVRWHGGALEFLGRADHQVKIRGFRVEPGEIEAVLRHHPSVGEAVVVAREDAPGERYLAAYVAPTQWRSISVPELREHLAASLPAWMVPAAFVVLDALPKTAGGKVDRRALPAPHAAAETGGDAAFAAPETETEAAVAEIWREVLALDRVGATDDFFDLGGHSLKATRILTRVGARLGVELPVGVIFDHPTVRGIAALVDERRAAAAGPDAGLLDWLENLSEEEAERLLAERAGGD